MRAELIRTVQASCSFAWSGVTLSDGVAYWDGGCARDVDVLPTAAGMEGDATVTVALAPATNSMLISLTAGEAVSQTVFDSLTVAQPVFQTLPAVSETFLAPPSMRLGCGDPR